MQARDETLKFLGKSRLSLAIHDASFPDGSPYEPSTRPFLEQMRSLGFNAVQLGPQGQTSYDNPSPYDATSFSRSLSAIAVEPKLVVPEHLDRRARHRYVYRAKRAALEQIPLEPFASRVAEYREKHRTWVDSDGLYDALEKQYGERHWREWPQHPRRPGPEHQAAIDRWALWQLLAEEQHQQLRAACSRLGLQLYGDLQVGLSPRDAWRWRELFLSDWMMGAPPSRTNPEGQPWGYPVLDPTRYADGGVAFLAARIERMASCYDGIRIDHPHGLVDPWVYRDDVVEGGRLFSAPDHPELSRYAIARSEQIDRTQLRWADGWVRELDAEQIDRYSVLLDEVVARDGVLICEVLSTQPHPLACALARHGLGRFRVTQKANLDDPSDVYRSENAKPEDWIMVGTHDTKPIWLLAREWQASGEAKRQAEYLARRLLPRAEPIEIERFAVELAGDRDALVHAKFADIFASDAENVMIFFADLFGLEEIYNRPGVIHEDNWTLRVPASLPALDLDRVLALALQARRR